MEDKLFLLPERVKSELVEHVSLGLKLLVSEESLQHLCQLDWRGLAFQAFLFACVLKHNFVVIVELSFLFHRVGLYWSLVLRNWILLD